MMAFQFFEALLSESLTTLGRLIKGQKALKTDVKTDSVNETY